jgi:hypothetical protein
MKNERFGSLDCSVLSPSICRIDGVTKCVKSMSVPIELLNNETGQSTQFPLELVNGEYFSEVPIGDYADYGEWIRQCLAVIYAETQQGVLPFEAVERVGRAIQRIDCHAISSRIACAPDRLHQLQGIDREHPYRKITLARTVFPVRLLRDTIPFFYEKYLINYSYDDCGIRRSTITPIHSHPLNYEVVYFLAAGRATSVTEEWFEAADSHGRPFVDESGVLNHNLVEAGELHLDRVTVRPVGCSILRATAQPVPLSPFAADFRLDQANVIRWTDGFFRPHRVSIQDDPDVGTLYYAINNYFGPSGRVYVYEPGGKIVQWSHRAWSN